MNKKEEKKAKSAKNKGRIHWPETILPPINLWNAPAIKYKGKDYGSY